MKIPVIVLGGFLGSGKTTLLKRLLEYAKSQSLATAVLMNEIGQSDVDGGMLREYLSASQLEKLMDGCICCSKKSEISSSLRKLIDGKPDVLFIELTGVANPEEIADALTEPSLMDEVFLHSIVTIVNADFFLDYNSILNPDRELLHTLRRQVETANFILVNKKDLVTDKTLLKVEKAVRTLNPSVPIRATVEAEIEAVHILKEIYPLPQSTTTPDYTVRINDGMRTFKTLHPVRRKTHGFTSELQPSFSKVKTVTIPLPSDKPLPANDLKRMSKQWGAGLLRAKGYVPMDGRLRLVQYSGGRITYEPALEKTEPYFVLIGFEAEVLRAKELFENWLTDS